MSKKKKSKARVSAVSIPPKTPTQTHPFPFKHLLAVGLMAAIVLVAYSNTFHVPFQFDDEPNILKNPNIQIKSFSLERLEQLVRNIYPFSIRIFAYFTFGLNYYFGGLEVFGYHLVNFLIHISSGILLYWFLLLTLNLPSLKERYGSIAFPIALFSSLLFLCHPIQTQSVTYIVQRMTSMAAMFYLLAMLLYVKGRLASGKRRLLFWAGTALGYLLGLFSKENVAILPLFVALYEFYFFQNLDLSPKGRKALFYSVGSVFLIGVLVILVWGKRYLNDIIEGYQIRDFTLTERVLTQFRVVLHYVTLLFYPNPSRLNLDYDFPTSHGILDPPTTLLSILIVVGLVGYSIWVARRKPLLSYFILWYFGNLVIESSIFPLEMVFEHRLYLPAIGPFVLFATIAVKGWQKIKERLRLRLRLKEDMAGGWKDYPLWSLLLVVMVLMVWGANERNKVWKDTITLWEDCAKKSPKKPRIHNNLGDYLYKGGQVERGLKELNYAIELDPKFDQAHFNLGAIYAEMNSLDKANFYFERFISLSPKNPEGYNQLGLIRFRQKKYDEAIQFLKKALEINPSLENIHANLGNAYLQTNRIDEAMGEYKKALQLNHDLSEVYVKIAEIYTKKGSPELAAKELQKALKINPSLNEAHILRGVTYIQEGKMDEAIAELNQALKDNSADPKIYNNLGIAYRRKRMLNEAIANYKKALALDPSLSDAHSNLGEIYLEKGMTNEAVSELQEAVRLDPDKAEVHNNLGVIFLQKRNLDEAISNFKRALAMNPKYGDAYFNLAVAYYYKRDISSATTNVKKALELGYEVDPRFLKALNIRN